MPSFDIVSEVDLHQLTNAVDQAGRIVANRFDFKGVDASFDREERQVVITADADFQIDQMQDMLRSALVKCHIDPKSMDIGEAVPSGKQVRQTVTLRHGLDSALCKKIVKAIKETKLKVQAQIQDEQVRVTGKKRDDLQQVMALLRDMDLEMPLQFTNFRD
ncbi:MAG: YajQ family cyclic di-GMP-binding protein [Gammaproteobacteria bacterium]|nr:YajQ family cyclic di-GMP-binding protein [Gammaproteobacteria bacterium]